jgi:hypothetical protein
MSQVNSVDIIAGKEQQNDNNASSGEQKHTIVHTTHQTQAHGFVYRQAGGL